VNAERVQRWYKAVFDVNERLAALSRSTNRSFVLYVRQSIQHYQIFAQHSLASRIDPRTIRNRRRARTLTPQTSLAPV
jgi:hypothetical protein